eukprot:scaffold6996_cov112-Isochrysis_galbana.AAC.2
MRRSANPAASGPRPRAIMPRARPAVSAYDSRQPSSSLVGGRAISLSITSVISLWPLAWCWMRDGVGVPFFVSGFALLACAPTSLDASADADGRLGCPWHAPLSAPR